MKRCIKYCKEKMLYCKDWGYCKGGFKKIGLKVLTIKELKKYEKK